MDILKNNEEFQYENAYKYCAFCNKIPDNYIQTDNSKYRKGDFICVKSSSIYHGAILNMNKNGQRGSFHFGCNKIKINSKRIIKNKIMGHTTVQIMNKILSYHDPYGLRHD